MSQPLPTRGPTVTLIAVALLIVWLSGFCIGMLVTSDRQDPSPSPVQGSVHSYEHV